MNVRITVLKTQLYEDLAEKFLTDGKDVKCSFFQEGDRFLYEGGAVMPEGFCPWAWVDIYGSVNALAQGATCAPWQNRDGVNVVCCSDGIRPVSFLLETEPQPVLPRHHPLSS